MGGKTTCSNCKTEIPLTSVYCPYCGKPVTHTLPPREIDFSIATNKIVVCGNCGWNGVPNNNGLCPSCGQAFSINKFQLSSGFRSKWGVITIIFATISLAIIIYLVADRQHLNNPADETSPKDIASQTEVELNTETPEKMIQLKLSPLQTPVKIQYSGNLNTGFSFHRPLLELTPETINQLTLYAHWTAGLVYDFYWSGDNNILAVAAYDGVYRFSGESFSNFYGKIPTPSTPTNVNINPNNTKMIIGTTTGTITLLDVYKDYPLSQFYDNEYPIKSTIISSNDIYIAATYTDETTTLWNITSGNKILEDIQGFSFSVDGNFVGYGSSNKVKYRDLQSNQDILTLEGHSDIISKVIISPDLTKLTSGAYDGSIIIWDFTRYTNDLLFKGHSKPITDLDYSSDGTLLGSMSEDNIFNLWKILPDDRSLIITLNGIKCFTFSPLSPLLVLGLENGSLGFVDLITMNIVYTNSITRSPIYKMSVSSDGHLLGVLAENKSFYILGVSNDELNLIKGVTNTNILGYPGSLPGEFQAPRDIAIAGDGSLYITDTGNNRIQHLAPDGTVLNIWGSFSDISKSQALPGTFYEPWGIGMGLDGSVYVVDTWNHRVQHFSSQGDFISMWGSFGEEQQPNIFWGPRDIVVDDQGRIYITDAGNKRIVVYDRSGQFLSSFGGAGNLIGQFNEPVGIALDRKQNIYIADTWNHRVQVLKFDDDQFDTIRSFKLPCWFGQSLDNNPYVAVDENGDVYLTDPESSRILIYNDLGKLTGFWEVSSSNAEKPPILNGIAADMQGGIWVIDSANSRIMRFAIPSR